jgi:hypothetical protein
VTAAMTTDLCEPTGKIIYGSAAAAIDALHALHSGRRRRRNRRREAEQLPMRTLPALAPRIEEGEEDHVRDQTRNHRAYVDRDFASLAGVRIWLVEQNEPGQSYVMRAHEPIFEATTDNTDVPPSLRLPEWYARPLLDSLAAYFGGTSEVQTLRRDYEAERKRVDRLIEGLLNGGRP